MTRGASQSTLHPPNILRVATYNIHKGVRGIGPRKRLEIHNIGLGIVKTSTANSLDVARAVREEADRIRPSLPEGTKIFVAFDTTTFIDAAVERVYHTLAEAVSYAARTASSRGSGCLNKACATTIGNMADLIATRAIGLSSSSINVTFSSSATGTSDVTESMSCAMAPAFDESR